MGPVHICNQALSLIGAGRIISFDDETTEADLSNALYVNIKQGLLRSFPWNCAVRREKLVERAEKPVNEWPFAFALPAECLRVLDVYQGDYRTTRSRNYHDPKYQIEGLSVLTWESGIYAKYIKDITEDEMDAHFQMALIGKLAGEMAYPITGSNTTAAEFRKEAIDKLQEARTVDGLENPNDKFRSDRLYVVRR